MTILSYDLPDTATRQQEREGLELRQRTLQEQLLLHADKMIELSWNLINPDEPGEVYLTVQEIAVELQCAVTISNEMLAIARELEGM